MKTGVSINRFQNDLPVLDMWGIAVVNFGVSAVLFICFTLLYVVITTFGMGILLSLPVLYALYYFNKLYRKVMIQLQRFHEITKSPLISSFTEDMHGVRSIRAYGFLDQFIQQNDTRLTKHLNVSYAQVLVYLWTYVRLELISNSIIGILAFYAIVSRSTILEIEPNSLSFIFYMCLVLRREIVTLILIMSTGKFKH